MEYFSRINKSRYTRVNQYREDGFMERITIAQDSGEYSINEINRIWIFFKKGELGNNYEYYAIRVQETDKWLDAENVSNIPVNPMYINAILNRYMISEGLFNKNYKPIIITSKITTQTKLNLQPAINMVEMYAYDGEGNDGEYILYIDSRMAEEIKRGVFNGNVVKYERHSDINGLHPDNHKYYVLRDGYELQFMVDGNIDNFDFNQLKPHYVVKKNYIKDDIYRMLCRSGYV
jgi:hypothetical protein